MLVRVGGDLYIQMKPKLCAGQGGGNLYIQMKPKLCAGQGGG